ncbi:AAWKG family protein [Streptomyces sp. NPDC017966]|uniref:AAWKG family protein n=1 Tax=Streptomyces sp. NPDC017966 TaxID=3365023 RepID=UPI0037A025B3
MAAEPSFEADPDDYWGRAVSLLTGYMMPKRSALFDKLKSEGDIPLFRMGFKDMVMRPVMPEDYAAISGWMTHEGEDYDLVFYTAKGRDNVKMQRARIVFIGVLTDENGRAVLFTGPETRRTGGEFTSVVEKDAQWDNRPPQRYIFGGRAALEALQTGDRSTKGFAYNGLSVADVHAVDIKAFTRTAQAFDRVKSFFVSQSDTLERWEKSLGDEQASWKGKAAQVFHNLIVQVRSNYADYVDQFGGKDYEPSHTTLDGYRPRSRFAAALAGAQLDLSIQVNVLLNAWNAWAADGKNDPHRAVLEELNEVWDWVVKNNISQIGKVEHHDSRSGISTTYHTTEAFSQVHPKYGDLAERSTYRKIAEAAVERWNKRVEDELEYYARYALAKLNNHWLDAAAVFTQPVETTSRTSLTEAWQKEQTQLTQEKLGQTNDALTKSFDGLGKAFNDLISGLNDFGSEQGGSPQSDNVNTDGLARELPQSPNGPKAGLDDIGTGGGSTDSAGTPTIVPLNPLLGIGSASSLNSDPAGTNSSLRNPDGSTTVLNSDGSLATMHPGGGLSVFNPATGTMTTTSRDGKTSSTSLDPGVVLENPDGSTTTLNPEGKLTTMSPDGSSMVVDPSSGEAVTTRPDGSVITEFLNPSVATGPTPDDSTGLPSHAEISAWRPDLTRLNDLVTSTDLHGDAGVGRAGMTLPAAASVADATHSSFTSDDFATSQLNPAVSQSGDDGTLSYEEYDSTPYSGGALGAPPPNGFASETGLPSGAVPLNPDLAGVTDGAGSGSGSGSGGTGMPMMPMGMGGMGGMGGPGGAGGGGGSSNSERVRNVLTDGDGAAVRRPKPRADTAEDGEDRAYARRGRTTTSSSYLPAGGQGTQGAQRTETSGRDRSGWEPEDGDVWGADEGGAPAVIGR